MLPGLRCNPDDVPAILAPGQPSDSVALSPDGKRIAFADRSIDGKLFLNVVNVDTGEKRRFEVGKDEPIDPWRIKKHLVPATMEYVGWPSNDRIVFIQSMADFEAIDPDGGHRVALATVPKKPMTCVRGEYWVENLRTGDPDHIMAEVEIEEYETTGNILFGEGYTRDFVWVNTRNGHAASYTAGTGTYRKLMFDRSGGLRAALDADNDTGIRELLLADESGEPKIPLSKVLGADLVEQYGLRPHAAKDAFRRAWILGFGFDPQVFFFESNKGRDTFSVYAVDLRTKTVSSPLAECAQFDLFCTPIYVSGKKCLGGLRYEDVRERTIWLVPEFDAAQKVLDAAAPNRVNHIQSWDDSLNRFLVFSYSDRDPGSVVLLDMAAKTIKRQVTLHPAVDPRRMASTAAAWVQTHDGRQVLCYLTVPPGAKPGVPGPMVVLLHGGPWSRDSWGFDKRVQCLAANGFLVLQVNFRGSEGFGFAHLNAARKRYGDAAREDVEDAIQWAIDGKVADPKRLFTMGASYGGYLALYLVAKNPDLFRGCVSVAGVTDLVSTVNDNPRVSGRQWLTYEFEKAMIGDPSKDKEMMRQSSPLQLAEQIRIPVLLIHGEQDNVVAIDQSERMEKKLRRLNREVELIRIEDAGHGGWTPEQEKRIVDATAAFLQRCDPGAGVKPAEGK